MAVSYGEIKAWREAEAQTLSAAMTSRIRAFESLEDDLRHARGWDHSWSGSTGEDAARTYLSRLGDTVTDRAAEAAAIRKVADHVANALSVLHHEVLNVEAYARKYQFGIGEDGTLTDLAAHQSFSHDEDELRTQARHDIRQTVAEIIDKGRAVEAGAAEGLTAVNCGLISDGGATSVDLATASQTMDVSPPPGDASPAEVSMWWASLSDDEKAQATTDHADSIRNRWGVPADIRDALNTLALADDLARTQKEIDELSDTRTGFPGGGDYRDSGQLSGADHRRRSELEERLYTLGEIDKKLRSVPESHLLQLDMDSHAVPEVTYSVGNPDLADNVTLTVPGYTTNPKDSFGGMADDALVLQRDASRLSPNSTTATIAFMGYQAPQDALTTFDLGVATTADAYTGAEKVSTALKGVEAANGNGDLTLSLFGHSYGSTTSGIAAQQLALDGVTPIDALALYGPPGFPDVDATPSVAPFGIERSRTFYMAAEGDAVVDVLDGARRFDVGLGHSPEQWGMQELSTERAQTVLGERYDTDGYNALKERTEGRNPGVNAHSIYPKEHTTSAFNLAAIATGNSDKAVAAG